MAYPWSAGNILTAADLNAAVNKTAWTSYVPVLGASGWSLGSTGADATGAYSVANDVVHFWARLLFGTVGATFSGVNSMTVTLPVTADGSMVAYLSRGGNIAANALDSSAGAAYGLMTEMTTTLVNIASVDPASTYLKHGPYVLSTIPFTWAAGDIVWVSGWYRKA